MLPHTEILIQAEKFLGYFRKFASAALSNTFKQWAESKDFDKKTERAIRREVDRMIRRKCSK